MSNSIYILLTYTYIRVIIYIINIIKKEVNLCIQKFKKIIGAYINTHPLLTKYILALHHNCLNIGGGKNGTNYKTNKYFNNAITKYGWDKFKHEIIFSNLSEFEAKELEIKYILEFKSNNQKYGYNLTTGGEGTNGYVYSKEQLKRKSLRVSGKK